MPVLPKPLFALRASWDTARMARRLSRKATAVPAQHEALKGLLEKLATTTYGREVGITAGMSYDDFHGRVPIRDHEQLKPYIERIKRGEPNVLWPGYCHWYAVSAGTTGKQKWLPVTEDLILHFRNAEAAALLYYTARVGNSGAFRGRHLSLDNLLTVLPISRSEVTGAPKPADSTPPYTPSWGAPHLAEPGEEVPGLSESSKWSARIEEIITRTLLLDITVLSGIPNWLLVFSDAVRGRALGDKMLATALNTIWPKLECVVHHGIPVGPFQAELKRTAGYMVNLHEIYFSSEAFVAAQDSDAESGLRLIEDEGVFFEFLPLADYDDTLPLSLAAKALPLEHVRVGEDYVLLVTTPAGLCRYVVGDIVRFVSNEPPRLMYVGRTQLRLNAFAENVLEKELTDALVSVCQHHEWTITNFHVAPLAAGSLTGNTRGRHEWWIELRPGTHETPTGPLLADYLDRDLSERSKTYAAKRELGTLEPPIVRLVMPGFFAHWLDFQHRWGGQQKMPRCRSDRQIADEFSALACFTAD
jgi:hypothetical protein